MIRPSAHTGAINLVISSIPPGSYLVRVLRGEGPEYDRMIVVTEEDEGNALFLSGWVGKPLGPRQWREARDREFPKARVIRFKRLNGGRERLQTLKLPPPI